MIPKKIWTIWLGGEMPELAKVCIETQKLPGYEHCLITLDNCYRGSQYVNDAIEAKRWVKAADWLRMYYLYTEGGIYLDADMEVLPGKNFDHLLDCDMFIPREECGHYANCGLGAVAGQPALKAYLDRVENNFKGAGDLVYEPGIRTFSDILWLADKSKIVMLSPDSFFPYNWQTCRTTITPNTLVFHHYAKSWVLPEFNPLPLVSIIIPTLGRPVGLQRCIDSIQRLNYPRHRVETIVVEGPETVPEKVKRGLELSHGNLIVYAANDMEFTPDSLWLAVDASKKHGLVSFASGPLYPDNGNICEHFLIRRDMIEKVGEIFSTRFHHVGCDNLLWAKCSALGEAYRCEPARVIHHHFTAGAEMDDVYQKGWSKVEEDREILREELEGLEFFRQ